MPEFRIQSHGGLLGVFFALDPSRSTLLLIGANKAK